jgi:hypothetical protein
MYIYMDIIINNNDDLFSELKGLIYKNDYTMQDVSLIIGKHKDFIGLNMKNKSIKLDTLIKVLQVLNYQLTIKKNND